MRVLHNVLLGVAVIAVTVVASQVNAEEKPEVRLIAPGWGDLSFMPPVPGSYRLPPLGTAADGNIVLSDQRKTSLHQLIASDKLTVISFIYVSCDDINGCPLSTFVMHSVKQRLREHPDFAAKVRLLSISFDPENDTPAVMRAYGQDFQGGPVEWLFGTFDISYPRKTMQETLRSYGQSVLRRPDNNTLKDSKSRVSAHILKAYLIDHKQRIRNIYGVDFLHPDILIADIQTLLMERQP